MDRNMTLTNDRKGYGILFMAISKLLVFDVAVTIANLNFGV